MFENPNASIIVNYLLLRRKNVCWPLQHFKTHTFFISIPDI